jgi:hypothetical protein
MIRSNDDIQSEIEHQKQLMYEYINLLRICEIQAARYGLDVPTHKVNEINITKNAIIKCDEMITSLTKELLENTKRNIEDIEISISRNGGIYSLIHEERYPIYTDESNSDERSNFILLENDTVSQRLKEFASAIDAAIAATFIDDEQVGPISLSEMSSFLIEKMLSESIINQYQVADVNRIIISFFSKFK